MGSPLSEHALHRAAVLVGLGLASAAACSFPRYGFAPAASDAGPGGDSGAPAETAADTEPRDSGVDTAHAQDTAPAADTADAVTDAATDADADADAAECPILLGGDVCTTVQKFTAPKQVLDGVGDEFCDVLATKFNASTGADPNPTPPPAGLDTGILIRAAWSPEALHLHVHVDQAKVFSPTPIEEVYQGDAIEVFLAGSGTLTGPFGSSTEDGALQAIGTPDQAPSSPARALIYKMGTYVSAIGASGFASRMVPGGYEIELQILWSDVRGAPVSGSTIGFDVGVDVRETGDVVGPKLQSFVAYRPSVVSTACPKAHPSCDDRTWCVPKLE